MTWGSHTFKKLPDSGQKIGVKRANFLKDFFGRPIRAKVGEKETFLNCKNFLNNKKILQKCLFWPWGDKM